MRAGVVLALGVWVAGGPAAAQGPGGSQATFRFTTEAGSALRALWEVSRFAGEERAACLAAIVSGDTVLVSRVLPLEAAEADSMGISAVASIERCGPPDWSGTVHTHVAEYAEGRPSRRFSGPDRVVMRMWYDRWRADGVFCLVWSERDAHCEADGVVGGLRSRPRPIDRGR